MTIDELAREVGLTVRNIRSHHARGLLPPPELRGRTGHYGPEHVERLRLIQRLQDEGLKLAGIKRLLSDPGERLLALKEAAQEEPETPELITAAELAERLRIGERDKPRRLMAKAERLGILVSEGGGAYRVTSPALLSAAEQVVARGVSLGHALDLIESVAHHSRLLSRDFVQLFMDDVWAPFAAAGMPEDGWDELAASIADVRPLAGQALLAVFRRALDEQIEATIDELARRL